jgi:hypothetical protein
VRQGGASKGHGAQAALMARYGLRANEEVLWT